MCVCVLREREFHPHVSFQNRDYSPFRPRMHYCATQDIEEDGRLEEYNGQDREKGEENGMKEGEDE